MIIDLVLSALVRKTFDFPSLDLLYNICHWIVVFYTAAEKLNLIVFHFRATVPGFRLSNVAELRVYNGLHHTYQHQVLLTITFYISISQRSYQNERKCGGVKEISYSVTKFGYQTAELLEGKPKQLESVQTTVKSDVQESVSAEISSYSKAVSKVPPETALTEQSLKKVVRSAVSKEDSSRNFVVFGK